MRSVKLALLGLLAVSGLAGCRFGQIPNPNEKKLSNTFDGEELQKNVRAADDTLTERLLRGEIDLATKKSLFHDYIREQVGKIDLKDIPTDQVWRYADVYRQLEDWKTTDTLYTRAVDAAKDEDRRVNDTLRLGEVKARLDDVPKGIEIVRSTFAAKPGGKAPILLAVLYEFAPAALGKGHDLEVAKLLESAIEQHLLTHVDPGTEPGQRFLEARPHHISRAWEIIVRVYRETGDEQMFRDAIERSDAMMRRFAQV
jgi:hypothetical protein